MKLPVAMLSSKTVPTPPAPFGEGGAVQVSWGVHDDRGRMNVMRSITWGIVGRCKTEASQKPIPVHPILAEALTQWRDRCRYRESHDWVFAKNIIAKS